MNPYDQLTAAAGEIAEKYLGPARYHKLLINHISTNPTLVAMAKELDEVWKKIQVPGCWTCDKCGFGLTKSILHASDGQISADKSLLNEVCPNDGQLMRPSTWKEFSESNYKRCCELLDERGQLQTKYTELQNKVQESDSKLKEATDDFNKIVKIGTSGWYDSMCDLLMKREQSCNQLTARVAELEKQAKDFKCGWNLYKVFPSFANERKIAEALNQTTKS